MPTYKEQRQTYRGPVEIWADGAKQNDATVRLLGYVEVVVVETIGPEHPEPMGGRTSWDGHLHGLTDHELMTLLGQTLELRFPDGRVGNAVLLDARGRLQGTGQTPFG